MSLFIIAFDAIIVIILHQHDPWEYRTGVLTLWPRSTASERTFCSKPGTGETERMGATAAPG